MLTDGWHVSRLPAGATPQSRHPYRRSGRPAAP